MDLQAILDGIESAGKQQIKQIEEDAKFQVSQINLKARQEAGEQENRILLDGRARLNREQALIEQQAVVRSLQIRADARQVLIGEVLEKVKHTLGRIRERKNYPLILSQLVDETLKALQPSLLEGQSAIIHFDELDNAAAAELQKKVKLPMELKFDIQCSGGSVAETEDQLVSVKNTIESRFEHAGAALQQKLSIFFEGKSTSV
ncbi:MAG: V-type ATP synthase subunit E [Pelolinea sp.]|nr:V-type ATP synthase subunit E [Pelolinea sp.]